MVLKNTVVAFGAGSLSRGELGNSLGPLGHGVLGQLPRESQAHGRLDLARGQRLGLVNLAEFP